MKKKTEGGSDPKPNASELRRWQRLLARQQAFEKKHGKQRAYAGPLSQAMALERLKRLQAEFEAGDRFALMQAIRTCAAHEVTIPEWAAHAYIKGFDRVLNARVRSWDEAFGAPHKKNANLAAIRKRRTGWAQAWILVTEEHRKGAPIGPALFEAVGKQMNIGKTLCEEFYYEAKRLLRI